VVARRKANEFVVIFYDWTENQLRINTGLEEESKSIVIALRKA
jgi:hypothetical protein